MRVEEPGVPLKHEDIEEATIAGAVRHLRPKFMPVIAVLQSLVTDLWVIGIGSDVKKPVTAPIEGWHDHINHPRADHGPSVLCPHKGERLTPRNFGVIRPAVVHSILDVAYPPG